VTEEDTQPGLADLRVLVRALSDAMSELPLRDDLIGTKDSRFDERTAMRKRAKTHWFTNNGKLNE